MTAPAVSKGDRTRHRILAAIEWYTAKMGYPPTFREVCFLVGRGLTTMHWQVSKLVEQGFLQPIPKSGARTLVIVSLYDPPRKDEA